MNQQIVALEEKVRCLEEAVFGPPQKESRRHYSRDRSPRRRSSSKERSKRSRSKERSKRSDSQSTRKTKTSSSVFVEDNINEFMYNTVILFGDKMGSLTSDDLMDMFSEYGVVIRTSSVWKCKSGAQAWAAKVEFQTQADFERCMADVPNILTNKEMVCKVYSPKYCNRK